MSVGLWLCAVYTEYMASSFSPIERILIQANWAGLEAWVKDNGPLSQHATLDDLWFVAFSHKTKHALEGWAALDGYGLKRSEKLNYQLLVQAVKTDHIQHAGWLISHGASVAPPVGLSVIEGQPLILHLLGADTSRLRDLPTWLDWLATNQANLCLEASRNSALFRAIGSLDKRMPSVAVWLLDHGAQAASSVPADPGTVNYDQRFPGGNALDFLAWKCCLHKDSMSTKVSITSHPLWSILVNRAGLDPLSPSAVTGVSPLAMIEEPRAYRLTRAREKTREYQAQARHDRLAETPIARLRHRPRG